MVFRAFSLVCSLGLALLCGCSSGPAHRSIDEPPPCRFSNGARLVEETHWFCVDVQDVIFGIDYNDYMERRFGGGPYD